MTVVLDVMAGKPSDTRLRVLEYLVSYLEDHRFSPTREEMAQAVGLSTRSTIQYHIDTLVEDGYVERPVYRHRMLRPTEAGENAIKRLRAIDGTDS